jgi:hypothetical protein
MPETLVIVGASLAVHFFSPRPAVDLVVACLTCRNTAEQSFICQHGGAPWPPYTKFLAGPSRSSSPAACLLSVSLPPLPSRSSEPLVRLMVRRLTHA